MKAVYLDNSEGKLSEVTIPYSGEDYVFPLNTPVYIEKNLLRGIIGNWEKIEVEWEKTIIQGMITTDCPRDKIYAIVGKEGINLFEKVILPEELQEPKIESKINSETEIKTETETETETEAETETETDAETENEIGIEIRNRVKKNKKNKK